MLRSRLERVLHSPPAAALPILIPLSFLYRGLSGLHRRLYSSGILKPASLPRPVVSVGNLTVGGGGKTPLTIWLARSLAAEGVRPAVLTRGYGRLGRSTRIARAGDGWREVGDEAACMVKELEGVPVAVSADRLKAGIELLRSREVDLFILDDGFQHHALRRDMDILAVDGRRGFGNRRLLPAGPLRDPLRRMDRADLIVITRAAGEETGLEKLIKRHSGAPVYRARYVTSGIRALDPEKARAIPGTPLLAFCGIAGPEGFSQTLKESGIDFTELMVFPDHHPYSREDVARILHRAHRTGAVGLVTTEKDAVRWPEADTSLPVYALSITPVVEGGGEMLSRVASLLSGGGSTG